MLNMKTKSISRYIFIGKSSLLTGELIEKKHLKTLSFINKKDNAI